MPLPFEQDLQRHAGAMRQLARSLVGEGHADDLVQDATLQVLTTRSPVRSLRGFLRRVLTGLASKHRRGELRRMRREADALPPKPLPSPDWVAEHKETLRRLDAALLALPEPWLGTILLRFFEDLSPSAIAQRTGVPLPTVRSRIARGVELLREQLDGDARGRDWRRGLAAAFGLPLAAPAGAASAVASVTTGVLLMGSGMKLLLGGAAAAAAAAAAFWFLQPAAPAAPLSSAPTGANAPALATAPANQPRNAAAAAAAADRHEIPTNPNPSPAAAAAAGLRGRCVDQQHNPIANAEANLTGWTGDQARAQAWQRDHDPADRIQESTTTSLDGSFRFRFAPPPPFQFGLRLTAAGHATLEARWHELQPDATIDLGDIVMPPGTLLCGRVVDTNGQPVPGTQVSATSLASANSTVRPLFADTTTTADDGRFACRSALAAGDYRLVVRGRELVSEAQVTLTGAPEQSVDITVTSFDASATLSGVVVDDLGHPLQNVRVLSLSTPDGSSEVTGTDSEGRFQLRRAGQDGPAQIRLQLSRRDLQTVIPKDRFAWGRSDLHLVMPHSLDFELRVVDSRDQSPVEEFTAYVLPANGGGNSQEYEPRATGHHDGGRVLVPRLRPGSSLVYVEPRTGELDVSGFVPVDIALDMPSQLTVSLPVQAQRRLRLATADGKPVAGATVQLTDRLGLPAATPARVMGVSDWLNAPPPKALLLSTASTDARGEVMLRGPAGRLVAVQLPGPGFEPMVVADVSLDVTEPLVVTVRRGASLRAQLLPEGVIAELRRLADLPATGPIDAGQRHELPKLRLWRHDGAAVQSFPDDQHAAVLADDGSFVLDGVPEGRWNVEVVCYRSLPSLGLGMRMGTTQSEPGGVVDLRDGERSDLSIDLSRLLPGRLEGLVLHNGAPLARQQVTLQPQSSSNAEAVPVATDAEGRFATSLRPGDYVLRYMLPSRGTLAALESAAVTRGSTTVQTFHLQSAPLRLRLLGADDKPVANVVVELHDAAGAARRWLPPTGADGWTRDDMELEPFVAFVLPKRLQDAAAQMQWRRDHAGASDPFASVRLRLGDVAVRVGETTEVTLHLPAAFDR